MFPQSMEDFNKPSCVNPSLVRYNIALQYIYYDLCRKKIHFKASDNTGKLEDIWRDAMALNHFNAVSVKRLYFRVVISAHNTSFDTQGKPYPCSLCEKAFSQKNHLKKHMMTHTGEKPHRCSQCDKSFSQNCHLITHLMKHTGDKPYQCSLCEKSFVLKSDLKQQ